MYQGETHRGAHEHDSVADLRIKNGSFARFALFWPYSSSNQTDLRLDQTNGSVPYLGPVVSKIASFELIKW